MTFNHIMQLLYYFISRLWNENSEREVVTCGQVCRKSEAYCFILVKTIILNLSPYKTGKLRCTKNCFRVSNVDIATLKTTITQNTYFFPQKKI